MCHLQPLLVRVCLLSVLVIIVVGVTLEETPGQGWREGGLKQRERGRGGEGKGREGARGGEKERPGGRESESERRGGADLVT